MRVGEAGLACHMSHVWCVREAQAATLAARRPPPRARRVSRYVGP